MEKKIQRWLELGFIDDSTCKKLLLDVKTEKIKKHKIKINITLYTVAVLLLGLGIITFVASNDWILKLLNSCAFLKILLMSLLTFLTLWGGWELAYHKKNFPRFGNALIFFSSLAIGATYALIGQIYNLNANSSVLIFLWLISVLPAAYFFKNQSINILSIVLFIIGVILAYFELSLDKSMIWTVFIPIFTGIALYTVGNIPVVLNKFANFSLSYKITGALPVFITLLVLTCSVEESYNITSACYLAPLIFLIILNIFNYYFQKTKTKLLKIETISLIFLLGLLLLILVLPSVSQGFVMFLAHLMLIGLIAFGFNCGYKFENTRIVVLTNWMLTIYTGVIYFRWGWSFLDKSLFFILGGVVLLSLGLFLEKRKKEIEKKDENL